SYFMPAPQCLVKNSLPDHARRSEKCDVSHASILQTEVPLRNFDARPFSLGANFLQRMRVKDASHRVAGQAFQTARRRTYFRLVISLVFGTLGNYVCGPEFSRRENSSLPAVRSDGSKNSFAARRVGNCRMFALRDGIPRQRT